MLTLPLWAIASRRTGPAPLAQLPHLDFAAMESPSGERCAVLFSTQGHAERHLQQADLVEPALVMLTAPDGLARLLGLMAERGFAHVLLDGSLIIPIGQAMEAERADAN